jgi:hypothetical protein
LSADEEEALCGHVEEEEGWEGDVQARLAGEQAELAAELDARTHGADVCMLSEEHAKVVDNQVAAVQAKALQSKEVDVLPLPTNADHIAKHKAVHAQRMVREAEAQLDMVLPVGPPPLPVAPTLPAGGFLDFLMGDVGEGGGGAWGSMQEDTVSSEAAAA